MRAARHACTSSGARARRDLKMDAAQARRQAVVLELLDLRAGLGLPEEG
jgi:hypothetical protein